MPCSAGASQGNAASANSAIGGRNAFTPTSPTGVNYSNVANVPASATEYNSDSNPGDYDMFQFPSLPSSVSSVFFTNTWAQLELDVAGSRTVEIDTYSSGTDSASSAFMPNVGTPGLYNKVDVVDPHTSAAWSVAAAAASERGVKIQT